MEHLQIEIKKWKTYFQKKKRSLDRPTFFHDLWPRPRRVASLSFWKNRHILSIKMTKFPRWNSLRHYKYLMISSHISKGLIIWDQAIWTLYFPSKLQHYQSLKTLDFKYVCSKCFIYNKILKFLLHLSAGSENFKFRGRWSILYIWT